MTDVEYRYGTPADKTINATGRIVERHDESGTISYEYGKMGEITKETRSLYIRSIPGNSMKTATLQFASDYLGRINQLTYPDGEVIHYNYDPGGQLIGVTGTRTNNVRTEDRELIKNIGYDEFGQRTFIIYGNGLRTDYQYDPYRHWLNNLKTVDNQDYTRQDLSYSFDRVGNVLTRTGES